MITVKVSPTLSAEKLRDPRFQEAIRTANAFFNSPQFTTKYRDLLCLHEVGHIVYARRAGCTNIRSYGPMMYWCDGCPLCAGNTPSVSKSSVSWTFPPNCDATSALKAEIGGIVFREILSDTPNDEAAIFSDMKAARQWFQEHVGLDEEAFEASVAIARAEILDDLKSYQFRELAFGTAREFQREVFPTPRLTASGLRSKRLGWMQ